MTSIFDRARAINSSRQPIQQKEEQEPIESQQQESVEYDPFGSENQLGYNKMPETQKGQLVASENNIFSKAREHKKTYPQHNEESNLEAGLRHTARTGSRVAETVAGMPGDILELGKEGVKYLRGKVTGEKPEEIEEKNKNVANKIYDYFKDLTGQEFPEQAKMFVEGNPLPTSQQLQEKSEELTKGYTKALTPTEKKFDEFTKDVTSLMVPGRQGATVLNQLGRATAIATMGHAGEKVAKTLGVGEEGQAYTKMGSMLLTSLFNPNMVRNHYQTLYETSRNLIPQGATESAQTLQNSINRLRQRVTGRGIPTASKEFINSAAQDVEALIQNGRVRIEDLDQLVHDLNERGQNFIYGSPTSQARAGARRLISELSEATNTTLAQYGQRNPQYYRLSREANEVFGAYHGSRRLSDFITRSPGVAKIVGASPLLASVYNLNIPGILGSAGSFAVGAGALKGAELIHRMTQSPALRRLYMQATVAAVQENATAFARNANKLKKAAEDDPEIQKILKKQKESSDDEGVQNILSR